MIYLLGLAAAIVACAVLRRPFAWSFAIASAVILAGFVFMRLFIQQYVVSIIAHVIVVVICWYAFGLGGGDVFVKVLISAFAAIFAILDITDFYKRKNQSYAELHVLSCALFLLAYAYPAYKASHYEDVDANYAPTFGIFATVICVLCIVFFGLTLIRAYMKNAIKLADTSQIDENAPVNYMYGNSNKFIGPIIAFIVAIMLVIQSRTSANLFASIWMGLMGGVAGICNLFSFLSSDQAIVLEGAQIAQPGTTLYIVEVVITAIILLAVLVAIIVLITKIYKSHWHKDANADETLESAAMVEKREWIYHREAKKTEDTSVTKAAEIPTTMNQTESDDAEAEAAVETVKEEAEAVKETVEKVITEPVSKAESKVEDAKEALVKKAEETKAQVAQKASKVIEEDAAKVEEVKAAVENKAEEVKTVAEDKAEEVKAAVEDKAEEVKTVAEQKTDEVKKPSNKSKKKK
ncbi:MAG: hypothetical protein K6G69_07750 [Lachnospiraceae bacterium]|nr:hypothetical protein [Lachnospiraceae bacterium]